MKRSLAVLAVLLVPALVDAMPVTDPAGWSLTIPDRYREAPKTPGALYSFAHGASADADFSAIQIQDAGGTIANEPVDHAVVERSARDSVKGTGVEILSFDYRKVRWKTFDLDVVISRMRKGDTSIVSLVTQVPLVGKAIQIAIAGPARDTDRLIADLTQIVSSIEGESSWLSAAERSERIGKGVGMVVGVLGALGLLSWWRRRARRAAAS